MIHQELDVSEFLHSGFDLKEHLASFLQIPLTNLENRLPNGADDLAAIHPGGLKAEETTNFYEKEVGCAHLLDLAAWHLNSAN